MESIPPGLPPRGGPSDLGAPLTAAMVVRIEEVCDRFEDAWKAGRRPRIEDYLDDTPEPGRSALLRELILVEIAYRVRSGDDPRPEDYRARLPGEDLGWLAGAMTPPGPAARAPGPPGGPTARPLRSSTPATPGRRPEKPRTGPRPSHERRGGPNRSSPATRSWGNWAAAAWAWSSRRGTGG
jgi:hypothetical protein